MSREAIVEKLSEDQRQWVEDLFRENERLRDALQEITEIGNPLGPPGAYRQCDFLKELARKALAVVAVREGDE